MLQILGILVVFGAVLGGFLMEKGNLLVLLQPAELLIIAGAGLGTVLIANPPHILIKIVQGILRVLGGSRFSRKRYLDSLKMMFELFNRARREGLTAVETDIDEPEKSRIFTAYPDVLKDRHTRDFICDTLRTATAGVVDPFDVDQMMELDLDSHHREAGQPVAALSTMADALPGLGIVAAVLGVVITMGSLGGPPEEIGHKVAAALVGTFLGILLCYGVFGPIASSMSKQADEERHYLQVLRVCIASFLKGMPPVMAVEVGRRAVPGHVRPSFKDVDSACRNKGPQAAAA